VVGGDIAKGQRWKKKETSFSKGCPELCKKKKKKKQSPTDIDRGKKIL